MKKPRLRMLPDSERAHTQGESKREREREKETDIERERGSRSPESEGVGGLKKTLSQTGRFGTSGSRFGPWITRS